MLTPIMPELNDTLAIDAMSSVYSALRVRYTSSAYRIRYSRNLVETSDLHRLYPRNVPGLDYYCSLFQIPEGLRPSTAQEELAIQLALERDGEDPRKAGAFQDLVEWQHATPATLTLLLAPKEKKNLDKPDHVDKQGRKFWVRQVFLTEPPFLTSRERPIGEVFIPEGQGRVIPRPSDPNNIDEVWDRVTGLPRVTSDRENDNSHKNHTTHFRISIHYPDSGGLAALAERAFYVAYCDVTTGPAALSNAKDHGRRQRKGDSAKQTSL